MRRDHYRLFSEAKLGRLRLSNRLVRSATWDPGLFCTRRMDDRTLDLYRQVAAGGVGLIITGDYSTVPEGSLAAIDPAAIAASWEQVAIAGYGRLAEVVRQTNPACKVFAQISADYTGVAPSAMASPITAKRSHPLTLEQIQAITVCLANAIVSLERLGFDGVEFHAAHGGLLSRFLSPYTNRRKDPYGGPVENRVRLTGEAIALDRQTVGDFPIMVKVNSTDNLEGGIDASSFPALAKALEASGVDALEISGGMWEALARTEAELGFRPVPMPESHTGLGPPAKQSYYLQAAEALTLDIPLLLVGGNRDVERLEAIVQGGKVDFIALCRPLIREPDLPDRWREGRGPSRAACMSCNACVYDMWNQYAHRAPWVAACLVATDRNRLKDAQRWLNNWQKENVVSLA